MSKASQPAPHASDTHSSPFTTLPAVQLFTDYNTIHDGKFLTVPLELFEVFEDKRDGTRVAAAELWPSAFLRSRGTMDTFTQVAAN